MLSELRVAALSAYFGGVLALAGVVAISAQTLGVAIAQAMSDAATFRSPPLSRVAIGLDRARRMAKWRPRPQRQIIARSDLHTETSAFVLARKMDIAQASASGELTEVKVEGVDCVEPRVVFEVVAAASEPASVVVPIAREISRRPSTADPGPAVAGWIERETRGSKFDHEESVARIIERSLRAEI